MNDLFKQALNTEFRRQSAELSRALLYGKEGGPFTANEFAAADSMREEKPSMYPSTEVYESWERISDEESLSAMIGMTFDRIECTKDNDDREDFVIFHGMTTDYKLAHEQDCCESVSLDDVAGNLDDLVGSPLTMAEVTSNRKAVEFGSQTWTFYKFATVKGYVTLRWVGESNGYYSEEVDLYRREHPLEVTGRVKEKGGTLPALPPTSSASSQS